MQERGRMARIACGPRAHRARGRASRGATNPMTPTAGVSVREAKANGETTMTNDDTTTRRSNGSPEKGFLCAFSTRCTESVLVNGVAMCPTHMPYAAHRDLASERGFVLVARIDALEEAVAKLNRKAIKLGLPPLELVRGATRHVYRPAVPDQPTIAIDGAILQPYRPGKPAEFVTRHEVRLTGQRVVLAGHEVVASVESVEGKDGRRAVFIHARKDAGIPARYWDVAAGSAYPECEHCGLDRQRHDAYIVRNVETGEHKQVGSTCMRDFTGHKSPEALLAWAEAALDLDPSNYEEDEYGGGGGFRPATTWETRDFLALVHAFRTKFGWVSRARAEAEHSRATVDMVLAVLQASPEQYHELVKAGMWLVASPDDEAAAARVIEETLPKLQERVESGQASEFERNLLVALQVDVVTARAAGLVAALFAVQEQFKSREEREREEAERVARLAHSQWVGQEGERLTLRLAFVEGRAVRLPPREFGNRFGRGDETRHVLTFEDANGNRYTLWAEQGETVVVGEATGETGWRAPTRKLVPGEWYDVRATVKQHGEYRSVKETTLTRADFKFKAVETAKAERKERERLEAKEGAKRLGIAVGEYRRRKRAADRARKTDHEVESAAHGAYYDALYAHLNTHPENVPRALDEGRACCAAFIAEHGWYNQGIKTFAARLRSENDALVERILREGETAPAPVAENSNDTNV